VHVLYIVVRPVVPFPLLYLLGIRIICPSELALYKSNSACWSRTKRTSSSSHWKLTCSCHDIAEKLLNWRQTTINHPLYTFSFGHSVVCPSSIYGYRLPFWYLQILLMYKDQDYDSAVFTTGTRPLDSTFPGWPPFFHKVEFH
jgi:hypothetical protein